MAKIEKDLNYYIESINKVIKRDKLLQDFLNGESHGYGCEETKGYLSRCLKHLKLERISTGRDRITYKLNCQGKDYVIKFDLNPLENQNENEIEMLKKFGEIKNLPKLYYAGKFLIEDFIPGKLLNEYYGHEYKEFKEHKKTLIKEIKMNYGLVINDAHEENIMIYNNEIYFIDLGMAHEEDIESLHKSINELIGKNAIKCLESLTDRTKLYKLKTRLCNNDNIQIQDCIKKYAKNMIDELSQIMEKLEEEEEKEVC